MAEPLGLIGVIGVAVQLIEASNKLYSSFKDAPADARNFILELQNLKTTLAETNKNVISNAEFEKAFQGRHSSLLSEFDPLHDTDTMAMLAACGRELESLLDSLKKREDGHRLGWERVKAAFAGPTAREAVENLQRRCLSLNLLFQADMAALAASTHREVKEGREEQRQSHRAQTHALDHIRKRADIHETRQERETVLNWLTPINYGPQLSEFLRRRQPGTGQWLLDSDEFQNWASNDSQVLFCPGIPGAGKTILTSVVIDHLHTLFDDNPDIGIAYVYCNFRRQDEQNADDLVASLLKQLASGLPSLPAAVKALHGRYHGLLTRPSLDNLIETLRSVVELYEERVFIVVDALDECHSSDDCRSRFLRELLNLQSWGGSKVKIFATSRPGISDIVEAFEGHPSLEIIASREDIERYLQGHMGELGRVVARRQDLQQEIIVSILDAVDGMFLLAHLFFQSLRDKLTATGIRKALDRLRQQSTSSDNGQKLALLSLVYDGAMERINGQMPGYQELARHVLSWITCARRPLTTIELQHAWAVRDSEDELDQDSIPEVEEMVSVCAGLVTIDHDGGTLRLVHYTTQEYFEQTLNASLPNAHFEIARTCASYLSFRTFDTQCTGNLFFIPRIQENPLFDYAARNWGHHAREAVEVPDEVLEFLEMEGHVEAANEGMCAHKEGKRYDLDDATIMVRGLHLAAHFGLEHVTMQLLAAGHDPNMKDGMERTPLYYATEEGHVTVVRALLATGEIDVNAADYFRSTPLHRASEKGHAAVVQALLNTGHADANRFSWWDNTPLMEAVINRKEAVVQLLLASEQVDIDRKNQHGWTALRYAVADQRRASIARLLVAYGAQDQGEDEDEHKNGNEVDEDEEGEEHVPGIKQDDCPS